MLLNGWFVTVEISDWFMLLVPASHVYSLPQRLGGKEELEVGIVKYPWKTRF